MKNTESSKGHQEEMRPEEEFKRLGDKRRSLEERAKILQEKAEEDKLAIDRKLLTEILEEENRTHNEAVKELEDKIANLDHQLKPSPTMESTPDQTPYEPVPEISDDAVEDTSVGILQQPEEQEAEMSQEGSRKKKRGFF